MPTAARVPTVARVLALPLALLLTLSGCSSRDHTNLFDPDNPDTDGRPRLVEAAAGNGMVDVTWTVPDLTDIVEARLVRYDEAEVRVVLPADVLASTMAFADAGVINGVTYRYELEFEFTGETESRRSAEVLATPGPTVIWVLDQSGGGPLRISPDGRAVADRPGRGRPTDMALHARTGSVVSADFINKRIEIFDRTGAAGPFVEVSANPQSVAWAEPDTTVWVAMANPSRIERLSGLLMTTADVDTGFGDPEDVAFDPVRGALWIADSDQGRLFHRRADGTVTTLPGFAVPFALALDGATGDAFLVDRARRTLYRISAAADTILWVRPGFNGLYGVLADPSTGGAWVSDNLAGIVTLVAADGVVVRRLEGWAAPTGLALDPGTGDLWITDAARDELVRVSVTGEIRQRLGGLNGPFAVVVGLPTDLPAPARPSPRPARPSSRQPAPIPPSRPMETLDPEGVDR